MSKQINLSLAKSGDVAVLRNGENKKIGALQQITDESIYIRFYYNVSSSRYEKDGTRRLAWISKPDEDILDILREGVSIFEPK